MDCIVESKDVYVGNCDEETDAVEIFFSDMLYQFLPKYQSLYQNSYINLYFCNIIFPSLFLLCFWQYYKENKQNTHKILSVSLK